PGPAYATDNEADPGRAYAIGTT
ncbi:MAG: hypothetical protein QOJ19_269, partial [Acidimicrobiia bacterium]|nr:hypothetical protein [Acidimicrobiia bacterium]